MSQAEIAGGAVTPPNELPSKGHRLHDFRLKSALDRSIQLSDYRGRTNLVLIVADDRPETAKLLSDAASQYSQIKNEDAEVLAITCLAREQAVAKREPLKLPYPVLADEGGRVHRELGAVDSQGHASAAVYVTDRFGEVFGACRTRDKQSLPGIADILNWLEFVNSQCPECEPPEWPV
jgi:peroxiredoxin